jgi:hypothetical protein
VEPVLFLGARISQEEILFFPYKFTLNNTLVLLLLLVRLNYNLQLVFVFGTRVRPAALKQILTKKTTLSHNLLGYQLVSSRLSIMQILLIVAFLASVAAFAPLKTNVRMTSRAMVRIYCKFQVLKLEFIQNIHIYHHIIVSFYTSIAVLI